MAVALERWVHSRSAVAAAFRLPMVFDDEERTSQRVDELIELMNLGDVPQLVRPRAVDRHAARASIWPAWSPTGRRSMLLDEPSSGIAQREVEALAPVLLPPAR